MDLLGEALQEVALAATCLKLVEPLEEEPRGVALLVEDPLVADLSGEDLPGEAPLREAPVGEARQGEDPLAEGFLLVLVAALLATQSPCLVVVIVVVLGQVGVERLVMDDHWKTKEVVWVQEAVCADVCLDEDKGKALGHS